MTRTLALVLAGGRGGRLDPLTTYRAKPAVPFGGHHRIVDVVLSNCLHSGVTDVWVAVQYNPVSLVEHLANGRPWDLDRNKGGLMVLPPRQGSGRDGWVSGTADGLWRSADLIRTFAPDALLVVSADAVYRMDYAEVVAGHLESGALATLGTSRAPDDPGRYGVVQVEGGRVTDYALKPDQPQGDLVANEVFVFDPRVLDVLDELQEQADEDLQDLGHELLPELVRRGEAREHRFDGYWRDIGTLASYVQAHRDLLGAQPVLRLDEPDWPVLTRGGRRGPARLLDGATLTDALLSPSTCVSGTVERSVLSPGVVVEPGAVVRDSVLLHDVLVRAGAVVENAVLDASTEVAPDARVGSARGEPVVVGARQLLTGSVPAGTKLDARPRSD